METAGRLAGRFGPVALVICAVLFSRPVAAQLEPAQPGPTPGLTVGATGLVSRWTRDSDPFDWFGGPGLQLGWLRPSGPGFEFRAGYLLPTGFYDMNGVWTQGMLTFGLPAGRHLVHVKGGGAAFLGGDSDGSVWAGGGPVAGGDLLVRVSGRVGLQFDAFAQVLYVSGDYTASPGASVGLVLLPRPRV